MNTKIDVHAHFLPADYREALLAHGHDKPDGFPILPSWDIDSHLALMDRLGIQASVLSVSSPGVAFGGDSVEWARRVNDAGAGVVRAHPKRFGLFASLPLPDVDASIREIDHAYDELRADGILLLTNYAGVYLGDERFEPVMAALHRRRARVFVHPTSPACSEATSFGMPRPVLEFVLDTTRAITNLVLSGTLARFPDMELIIPHAGAALPVLADRIAGFAKAFPLRGHAAGAVDVLATLQRLNYEIGAGFPFPRHVRALLELIDGSRLLFGTDYPFGNELLIAENIAALLASPELDDEMRSRLFLDYALELFPRLR